MATWLFGVAVLVFAMVVLGGATRLTGSGLSITEWRPLTGALPPLSARQWGDAFNLYRATPQYRFLNSGMNLADFKLIFWWEWAHRLAGRLVGLAYGAPLLIFLSLRRMPPRLLLPCVGILGLGGLQGLVGWWMVRSGLEARTSVAPERLATHLGLALILLGALAWTAMEAWSGGAKTPRRDRWTWVSLSLTGLVFVQCLMGALVAGNRGGLVDSDWPLMGHKLFPADYWRGSWWESFVHGPAASQFDHRIGAYLVLAATTVLAFLTSRSTGGERRLWAPALALASVAWLQVGLGIAALVTGVPLWIAILHQAGATLVLVVAVVVAWVSARA